MKSLNIVNAQLKNTCLFSHYNSNAKVEDYVYTYLSCLHSLGFRNIFISNSPINDEDSDRLSNLFPGIQILIRENKGYDFGGWAEAINKGLIPEDSDYLLLTNDSIIGPLHNLDLFFKTMQKKDDVDFWGLTDNYQLEWHIQSFFICFSKKVYSSDAFKTVFRQNFNNEKKIDIIKKGEIFLTKHLTDHGFKAEALIPYKKFDQDITSMFALNPTHFFWDKLIIEYNFPFVKKDLILQNPENLQNLGNLFPLVQQVSDYNIENIKKLIVNNIVAEKSTNEQAKINVLCHLYYPHSMNYFLSKLAVLKNYNTSFFFNLADTLANDYDFIDILAQSFPGSIIIHSPDKGRDIGGKLAVLDIMLKIEAASNYTLIIHDKFSAHTPTGKQWRDKLLKIIDEKEIPNIIRHFRNNPKNGVIGTKDFIKNEYNPDKNAFDCTSSSILLQQIERYKLKLDNYNFIAGSIFWIRSEILMKFFSIHNPLSIRKELEEGNALDFVNGTLIHSWERLFSMIATDQQYSLKGI